jgi:hypothetical protein
MTTRISLISMPWATPYSPSIQMGLLKAHMDAVLGDRVETRCHSAHLGIRLSSPEATSVAMPLNEHAYMLLVLGERERARERRKGPGPFGPSSPLAAALRQLTATRPPKLKLTRKHLSELGRAT